MAKTVTLGSITSDDLEAYCDEDFGGDKKTPRMKAVAKLLKGKVKVGEFFDWKEEEEMLHYLIKAAHKYPEFKYAYDAYPGGDGTQVVLSKVKLPKADKV